MSGVKVPQKISGLSKGGGPSAAVLVVIFLSHDPNFPQWLDHEQFIFR